MPSQIGDRIADQLREAHFGGDVDKEQENAEGDPAGVFAHVGQDREQATKSPGFLLLH